jgi:putative hydrolase of the HAD superfamily
MYKNIFFDLDDTLLDDIFAKEAYLPIIYAKYKEITSYTFKTFKSLWYLGIKKYIPKCENGEINFSQQQQIRFEEAFGIKNAAQKLVADFYNDINHEYENWLKMTDGAAECIHYLKSKKYRLGIISNGSSVQQWNKIRKFNFEELFDVIVISQDIGYAKPAGEIFTFALAKVKANAEETVYIGDDFEKDVKGCYQADIMPCWYNVRKQRLREKVNFTYIEVSSFRNIMNCF